MKLTLCLLLATCVIAVNSFHMFEGTSLNRELVTTHDAIYGLYPFIKRKEYYYFKMPAKHSGKEIKGILAEDKTNTDAMANVKSGGVGYNYATIRLKSARAKDTFFRIFVYV